MLVAFKIKAIQRFGRNGKKSGASKKSYRREKGTSSEEDGMKIKNKKIIF
jgi:hypothetical protein